MSQQLHEKTAVERAFELARSGEFVTVEAIRRRLSKEGYDSDKLYGPQLLRQLRTLLSAEPPHSREAHLAMLERIRRGRLEEGT